MTRYSETGTTFEIRSTNTPGCLFALMSVLGLLEILIGGLLILSNLIVPTESSGKIIRGCLFVIFIGIGFLYAGVGSRGRKSRERIVFDKDAETVSFFPAGSGNKPYRLPFARISQIHGLREERPNSGKNGFPTFVYSLYLNLQDGAEFFLAEFIDEKEKARELIGKIANFTGLAVRCDPDPGMDRPATKIFREPIIPPPQTPGPFIIQSQSEGADLYQIKPARFPLIDKFVSIIISLGFGGIPVLFWNELMHQTGGWFTHVKVLGGLILWYSIFVLFTIVLPVLKSRKYAISVSATGLVIHISYKIFKSKNQEIPIPASVIRFVRTNRGRGGVSLSVGVDPDFPGNGVQTPFGQSEILESIFRRTFGKPFNQEQKASKFFGQEKEIVLWEFSSLSGNGTGAGLLELFWLEHMIEDRLGLKENRS